LTTVRGRGSLPANLPGGWRIAYRPDGQLLLRQDRAERRGCGNGCIAAALAINAFFLICGAVAAGLLPVTWKVEFTSGLPGVYGAVLAGVVGVLALYWGLGYRFGREEWLASPNGLERLRWWSFLPWRHSQRFPAGVVELRRHVYDDGECWMLGTYANRPLGVVSLIGLSSGEHTAAQVRGLAELLAAETGWELVVAEVRINGPQWRHDDP
jgi:hypothetical protein